MADPKAVIRRIQNPAPIGNPTIKRPTNPVIDKNVKDFARKGPDPTVGTNYYAWQTASGKKPDFGKGQAGPGTPYREVLKNYKIKQQADVPTANIKPAEPTKAMRDEAIRRRLTGTPQKKDPVATAWRTREAMRLAKESRKPDLNAIGKVVSQPRNDVPRPNPNF